jgi:hypothetical protein
VCEFNREDVLTLARAVNEAPITYQDSDYRTYYWCEYCDAELEDFHRYEDFIHDTNCPVLVARDVLTRNE